MTIKFSLSGSKLIVIPKLQLQTSKKCFAKFFGMQKQSLAVILATHQWYVDRG